MFNILSFERKLVELVEELRLRRNLENENEKTLKSLMDEKYKLELHWDEEQRRFTREKEDLEQTIELLRRKLEDKMCVNDDDKAKQHVINRTYSHEIKMLKEELRSTKPEKLNFLKKIQELEGKLSLHNNFQENIVSQVAEVGKTVKSIYEETQALIATHNNVMENVASVKESMMKFDLCNQHLMRFIGIVGKKNEALKKELVRCQSETTMLQNSVTCERESRPKNNLEVENLQIKVLDLENLLLISRQENEKTLRNFVESNNLLCKFMDKYSENQNQERKLTRDLDQYREKLRATEKELRQCQHEMEDALTREKQRIENQRSAETQTDKQQANQSKCSSNKEPSSNAVVPVQEDSKTDDGDSFLTEMRQDLLDLQEISNQRRMEGFQLSGGKKITFSEVLKRKMEVSDSGDRIEMISMKKRIFENSSSLFDEGFVKGKEGTVSLRGTEEPPVPKRESDHKMAAFGWSMDQKFLLSLENEPDEETSEADPK